MPGEHHINGSSRLELRDLCPGSYAAELPLWDTPREDDEEQIAGRRRHAVADRGMTDRAARPVAIADLSSPEDRELVESWWAYWDRKVAGGSPIDGGAETPVTMHDGRYGTTDAWLLWRDDQGRRILTVGDLKNMPPTAARRSLQLGDYAKALLELCLVRHNQPISAVELAFVSRMGVDEWRHGIDTFDDLSVRVGGVIARSTAPDAPRLPGDHCARCLAAESCGARAAVAVRSATLFDLVANPVTFLAGLDPERRTATLDALGLAAEKLAEAESSIKAAIREGTLDVPLYKVVPSTRTAWRNEAEARTTLLASHPDRTDELTPLCSPNEAAKALGKAAIENLTERRPGTPSVRRSKNAA